MCVCVCVCVRARMRVYILSGVPFVCVYVYSLLCVHTFLPCVRVHAHFLALCTESWVQSSRGHTECPDPVSTKGKQGRRKNQVGWGDHGLKGVHMLQDHGDTSGGPGRQPQGHQQNPESLRIKTSWIRDKAGAAVGTL